MKLSDLYDPALIDATQAARDVVRAQRRYCDNETLAELALDAFNDTAGDVPGADDAFVAAFPELAFHVGLR